MISAPHPDEITVLLHPSKTSKLAAEAGKQGKPTVTLAAELLEREIDKIDSDDATAADASAK